MGGSSELPADGSRPPRRPHYWTLERSVKPPAAGGAGVQKGEDGADPRSLRELLEEFLRLLVLQDDGAEGRGLPDTGQKSSTR